MHGNNDHATRDAGPVDRISENEHHWVYIAAV